MFYDQISPNWLVYFIITRKMLFLNLYSSRLHFVLVAWKFRPSLSYYVRSARLKARPVGGSLTCQPTRCLPRTIRNITGKLLNYPYFKL